MSETISSSTTDYPYTVTHIVTDNYSYFGHTISNDGDNYSRTVKWTPSQGQFFS